MERRSVSDFLDDFLAQGSEWAYVHRRGYRTERWTYRQVAESAFQLARELEARGIAKGDRVLIWGENRAEWVAAFFACALRAAIAVPMDDTASPEFALRVHGDVDAKLVVCSRKHAAHVQRTEPLFWRICGRNWRTMRRGTTRRSTPSVPMLWRSFSLPGRPLIPRAW